MKPVRFVKMHGAGNDFVLVDDRDGDFGSKTQTAVKLFQQAAGLEATGIADSATLTRMYADDAPTTEYAQVTPTPPPAS